ncbi:SPFH domain-containing protein [Microvirga sp. W0021]|uniref:SPFH domain-containing protein n=1 Tax=Hohaiivirga grylli TaxID=3133970 RepID=A0ABV0BM66_9HYPH
MKEKRALAINGYLGIILIIIALGYCFYQIYLAASTPNLLNTFSSKSMDWLSLLRWPVFIALALLLLTSLTVVQPNQGKVIIFFGRYLGTIRKSGLFLTVPFTQKSVISLRVRNFNSSTLKVNDIDGNPIEIAAVVVFRVIDTAKAAFDVEYYEDFVAVQSEAAIRHVATQYPYDSFSDTDKTLRGNAEDVSRELTEELQARLAVAGVEVMESRLTHLAYATEIASAMLQRQQAKAILSARQTIVEGAVGMTCLAIEKLEKDGVLKLGDEHRLQLVNNLMVAIVSDRGAQPVLNTGS